MSDEVAIRVEGLGKQYFIGESSGGYRTLRDAVSDAGAGRPTGFVAAGRQVGRSTASRSGPCYVLYWDLEKEKCRRGAIFKSQGKTWYITRDYYMWLNFLPIYNKEVGKFTFADVCDAQYHMALYEEISKLSYKHVAILKKRQIASSYFHAAKMINGFWFEEGCVNKMAASLKDYINEKGTWRFLDEYRNFLNTHTAWYRPCQPDKTFNWEQKIEVKQGGRNRDIGLKSVMIGITLEKDPTAGVGGPCNFFFHEEAEHDPNRSGPSKQGMIRSAIQRETSQHRQYQSTEETR